MRLIDADALVMRMRLIDANALVEDIEEYQESMMFDSYAERMHFNDVIDFAVDHIEEAPTIDAVQVVRCKDCKWWGDRDHLATDNVKYCQFGRYMVGANGYCIYGEVKE